MDRSSQRATALADRLIEACDSLTSLLEQLALTTKPPKAGSPSLAETIEELLIGHVEHHRREIEPKVGRP